MAISHSSNSKKKHQVGYCDECGSAFEKKQKRSRFCSQRCYMRDYDRRPETRERDKKRDRKEYMKKYGKGEKKKEYMKEYGKRPDVIERDRRFKKTLNGKETDRRASHKRRAADHRPPELELSTLIVLRNGQCCYCKIKFNSNGHAPELEHIRPLSKGGTNAASNLDAACAQCNRRKGGQDIGVFLADYGLTYEPLPHASKEATELEQLTLF